MNRRKFFGMFATGVAGIALKEAIPFNRVWSFPSNIRIATLEEQGVLGTGWGIDWAAEKDITFTEYWRRLPGLPQGYEVIRTLDGNLYEVATVPVEQAPFVLVGGGIDSAYSRSQLTKECRPES